MVKNFVFASVYTKLALLRQGVGEEFQLFLTIGLLFLTSYIFLLSCHPFRNRRHQRRGEITDPQEKNEEKKDSKLEEEESAAKAVKENIQNLPITTNEYENEEVSFNQYQNSEEQIKKYITVIDEFS
uniref:Uncharacterized protein n=1 Tax=Panagrolaimus davidi TaxID=227884 RepID=A0A914PWQ7_9BILA